MSQLIPQDVLDAVRQANDIVDVVGQHVQLKKSGKNYLGLCPFHNEKTPSFTVAQDKQIFHCFGCGKGGNVFTFIQEIEGVSFPEAVQRLAEEKDVPLPNAIVTRQQAPTSPTGIMHQQLIAMHEKAADLYHHVLMNTQIGEEALAYLETRGLTKEIIETFRLGFAPKDRSLLNQVLQKEGFSNEQLEQSGLVVGFDNGDWRDRFFQRIMFPITNQQGKIIGFSGRILETSDFDSSDQPKYLNSPETILFNKRQVIYNFDKARVSIRKENDVFLFEGFMDVISATIAGVPNAVATMGTSLTTEQIKVLERVSETVTIAYDGDDAGIEATTRAVDLIQAQSTLTIQVSSIPYQMDPDDYRKTYGNDALKNILLNEKKTVFQFKRDYLKRGRNLSNDVDKVDYTEDILQELATVHSVIETDMALSQLSEELDISRASLQDELRQIKTKQKYTAPTQEIRREIVIPQYQEVKRFSQVEKAERLLIYRLLNERSVHQTLLEETNFSFVHEPYQQLYQHISSFYQLYGEVILAQFIEYLKEEPLKNLIVSITMQSYSEESSKQEIIDCLNVLGKASIHDKLALLKKDQEEAKHRGDSQAEVEATMSIIQLQKQLKSS